MAPAFSSPSAFVSTVRIYLSEPIPIGVSFCMRSMKSDIVTSTICFETLSRFDIATPMV